MCVRLAGHRAKESLGFVMIEKLSLAVSYVNKKTRKKFRVWSLLLWWPTFRRSIFCEFLRITFRDEPRAVVRLNSSQIATPQHLTYSPRRAAYDCGTLIHIQQVSDYHG